MKPSRVFLSVQSVGYKRPPGADPFTYRETRPLRHRASWWTRGTSTELYRGQPLASAEEAVRLARRWLERENKDGVRWIDTTDNPERYGYAHASSGHATKKKSAQLDAEIAEALSRPPTPSVVYLQTRGGQNHELSGRRLAKLRKEVIAGRGGPTLTNFAASGYVGFVGPDGELWDLDALPAYLSGGA